MSEYKVKCDACKQSIKLFDVESNDLVYFDGKFYHENCYKEQNSIKKKCKHCNKDIIYDENNDKNIVLFDERYYHKECFIEYCHATKRPSKKRTIALQHIDEYECEASTELKIMKQSKYNVNIDILKKNAVFHINRIRAESKMNAYLKDVYGLRSVSPNLWRVIKSIYEGTYKNGVQIPPDHLMDMFKRQQNSLVKIYQNNISKGKNMSREQRVLYDLAVLSNKYDGYLHWLEKQKKHEKVQNEEIKLIPHSTEFLTKLNSSDESISDLVEDIFKYGG